MNINKTNYQSWFLDYYEGNLPAIQVAELFLFLQQYPGLQEEFDAFQPIVLTPADNTSFDAKEGLKRDVITMHNIDYYLVRELENDLTSRESTQLHEFLQLHPALENDRDLYRKTILQGAVEVFNDKKSLRKTIIRPLYNQWNFWAAAAAVILVVLGILYINRPGDIDEIAEKTTGAAHSTISHKGNSIDSKNNNSNYQANDDKAIQVPYEEREQQKALPFESAEKITNQPNANNLLAYPTNNKEGNQNKNTRNERRGVHKKTDNFALINLENIAMAQRREIVLISNLLIEVTPEKKSTALATSVKTTLPEVNQHRSFTDKINELKDVAAEKINKSTGEEILYSQQQLEGRTTDRLPFKSRMIKMLAWSLNKISGEKVQLKTDFDQAGNLAAYEISAGKLKVERGF